jgi:hypothetical protein
VFVDYYVRSTKHSNNLIFCGYDGTAVPPTADLKMSDFTTPYEWGASFALQGSVAFGASTNYGCLAAYQNEAGSLGSAAYKTALITTDWVPPILKNTKRQGISFTFTPSLTLTLYENDAFSLRLKLVQLPTGLTFINLCTVSTPSIVSDALSCTYSGLLNTISFTFRNVPKPDVPITPI